MNGLGYGNENMPAGDPGRRMLDVNKNISNVATYESLRKELREVLEQIIEYMKPHCGPKSKYAMIITGLGVTDFEPNIFTKDGIKTLSYIEYASCIQAYIKNFLTYIGKRVDNMAKDGTTTSMLFAAMFMLACIDDAQHGKCKLTTVQKEKHYKELLHLILNKLKEYTYTYDDIAALYDASGVAHTSSDVGGAIAYMQTLSSSGGNQELAEVMRDVFAASPPEAWEHLQMMQSTLEKDKSFEVHYQASDYKLLSILATSQILNTDLNTRYVDTNVRVFVYPDDIDHGLTILDKVMSLLSEFPDEQPLAIVGKRVNPLVIKKAEQLNMTRKYPISIHVAQDDNKYSRSDWELMAILAMSGTVSMLDPAMLSAPTIKMEHTFVAERLEVSGSYLELFNIVRVPSTEKLHPYYLDKTLFQPYTDLLNSLLHIIDRAKHGHEKNQYLVQKASAILLQMTSLHAPTIMVAGSTHENLSNLAVVQDALGATMSSLEHGFLAGGLLSVVRSIWEVYRQVSDMPKTEDQEFMHFILANIGDSLTDLLLLVCDAVDISSLQKLDTDNTTSKGSYYNALSETPDVLFAFEPFIDQLINGKEQGVIDYPVLQPVAIYKELFERTGELLVRLLSTDKIIVPGGAFTEQSNGTSS